MSAPIEPSSSRMRSFMSDLRASPGFIWVKIDITMDPPLVRALFSLQDRALCRFVPVEMKRAAFLYWLEKGVLIQRLSRRKCAICDSQEKADPRLPWRVIGLRTWSASLPDHPAAKERTGLGTLHPLR